MLHTCGVTASCARNRSGLAVALRRGRPLHHCGWFLRSSDLLHIAGCPMDDGGLARPACGRDSNQVSATADTAAIFRMRHPIFFSLKKPLGCRRIRGSSSFVSFCDSGSGDGQAEGDPACGRRPWALSRLHPKGSTRYRRKHRHISIGVSRFTYESPFPLRTVARNNWCNWNHECIVIVIAVIMTTKRNAA
jgi:hypothetical protein